MTFKPEPGKLRDYKDLPLGDVQADDLERIDAFVAKKWGAIRAEGWEAHPLVRYAAKHSEDTEEEPVWQLSPSTIDQVLQAPEERGGRFSPGWLSLGLVAIVALALGFWLGRRTQPLQRPDLPRRVVQHPPTPRAAKVGSKARHAPKQEPRAKTLAMLYPWVTITCFVRPNTPVSLVTALQQETGLIVTAKRPSGVLKQRSLNALWFGKRVPLAAVKRVALLLLKEGIQLRAIRPFKAGTGKAANIQIGADLRIGQLPVWTRQRIQDASAFTRRNTPPRKRSRRKKAKGKWRKFKPRKGSRRKLSKDRKYELRKKKLRWKKRELRKRPLPRK